MHQNPLHQPAEQVGDATGLDAAFARRLQGIFQRRRKLLPTIEVGDVAVRQRERIVGRVKISIRVEYKATINRPRCS